MKGLNLTKQLLDRFVLSDFLPMYAYDKESGAYILAHGVGVAFECSQIWGGSSVVDAIKGLYYQDFPAGTTIQYLTYASPIINYLTDTYVLVREKQAPSSDYIDIAKRKKEFIESGSKKSLLKGYDFRTRNFKHFITITVSCDSTPDGYEQGIGILNKIKSTIYQALNVAHLNPKELYPSRYITILSELINPSHDNTKIQQYDEKTLIREQICYSDTELIVEKDYLKIDNKYIRSLTIRQYPEKWDISDTVNYVGSLYDNVRQIPTPFLITMNTEFPDKVKALTQVQQRQMTTAYQLFGPIAKWFPELAEKKAHLDRYLASMRGGDSPVYAYMNIILYADSLEELENVTSLTMNLYRSLGFILQIDTYISFPLFIQALPFGYQRETQGELRRRKLLKGSDIAELAPLASDWQGFGTPIIQLVSRRGQLQFFDIFSNPQGGYSGIVVAATGAGKSFFVNEFITSYLSVGAKIWVIDVGRSYEKLCSFCNGNFLVFGAKSETCINPFTNIRELNDEIPILKSIIAQMISMNKVDELTLSYIEEAIKECYMEYGNDTTITNIAEYFTNKDDPLALSIAKRLFPYTTSGAYGSYFNGKANLQADANLVVMELEELKSKKDLQEVVLLSLIFQIQQAMMDRETYKILIIDEAWDLLIGGNTTDYMETAYRRFRKYKGACLTITQSVNDFYRIPAGIAMIENSDFMFLLRQRPESIKMLKESGRVSLTEGLYELLTSVHTDQGNYSEIFVYTPVGITISRLIVDRFTQLLYTSRADEYTAIKKYLSEGLSITEAIERVIQDEDEERMRLLKSAGAL